MTAITRPFWPLSDEKQAQSVEKCKFLEVLCVEKCTFAADSCVQKCNISLKFPTPLFRGGKL